MLFRALKICTVKLSSAKSVFKNFEKIIISNISFFEYSATKIQTNLYFLIFLITIQINFITSTICKRVA